MATFEEAETILQNSRQMFEANVQDSFGQSVLDEVYEPFGRDLRELSAAAEEAGREQQAVKTLLMELRMII